MNNRSFIIAAVISIFVMAVIYLPKVIHKGRTVETQMARFPMVIDQWQGKDMPLEENVFQILETKNLIMREYSDGVNIVYLYIIYSGDNRKALHPPEICYTGGGGTTVLEKKALPLTASLQANEFITQDKGGRQLVTYWFRAGNYNTASYVTQQLKTALGRALGKQTSGAMIRLSTIVQAQDNESALNTIKAFAKLIEPLLDQYVP